MWMLAAVGSALFAGVTSILAKVGIRDVDSNLATALRTSVVVVFSWLMVLISGAAGDLTAITGRTMAFLVLSGLATGASWLCYFRALQLGDVNQVVPVDKSSIILTVLLAFFLLKEPVSLTKAVGLAAIGVGTYLMIQRKGGGTEEHHGRGWFFYAAGSAVFASLTSILGKIGISGVESNLGTAIRTGVVLVMAWVVVFVTGKQGTLRDIPRRELGFICLSGLATGGSWLCYYKALQSGPASVVAPVDQLSILVTTAVSAAVLHEPVTRRTAAGLVCLLAGVLCMLI